MLGPPNPQSIPPLLLGFLTAQSSLLGCHFPTNAFVLTALTLVLITQSPAFFRCLTFLFFLTAQKLFIVQGGLFIIFLKLLALLFPFFTFK